MNRIVPLFALLLVVGSGVAEAQKAPILGAIESMKIVEAATLEVTPVKNAPFVADAVTEFTQVLGDGNRIERSYASSILRDSRGRTRREELIALVGPLASAGAAPRLVTIFDPDSGVTYTL